MAVQKAPRITSDDAVRIAGDLYGLKVLATPLPSERDQNFLLSRATSKASPLLPPHHSRAARLGTLESGSGPEPAHSQFVLKIANSEEAFAFLELQNQLIQFLTGKVELEFPRIVRTKTGADIATIKGENGDEHFVRLLTWVEGTCLARAQPHDRRLLFSLGRALAQMDAALTQFSNAAAHRSFYWDLRNAAMARESIGLLPESRRPLVERFFGEWEKIDWSGLRFSVIHNDANDYNILVSEAPEPRVAAILDYGDLVYTATVCELAVALAYVMLDKHDPIGTAAQVVAAYHETYPLTESEIDALYTLAVTRLCCSVCFAARQTRDAPDNEYLNISNTPVWALLEKLATIPPQWANRIFRYACGLPVEKEQPSRPRRPRAELLSARQKHLGSSLSISYQAPLHIVCGSRQYLYDADGRRFLDCVNNVAHVGHSHPRVVRAASDQMTILNTNTRYLHELLIEYSERLTATLPEPLSVVYLVCSGSEANELALRLARTHTGRTEVIVVEGAYHGNTSAMIDLSPYKFDGRGGSGCPSWVHKVSMPDVYRGAHHGPGAGRLFADDVAQAARQISDAENGLAAFFCESALGCGGQIILPSGYLGEAYAAVRTAGGVCVADEVQTGFGRAGTHFWMFETQGVIPDIVTLGKPIGNGHPLGAVITTPEIAASFANGMEYFNTFGGNPVSCAAGLAVLDVIRDEELQQNAFEVGEYLKNGLRRLQNRHSLIGDVRGLGLFLGVELVRNRESLEPAGSEAAHLVERMKERGILLSTDGPLHNVIKIKPPLVFSQADADVLLSGLEAILSEDYPVMMSGSD
jgi:4-aminobutyrate aminotransferase-like enzyme/Ser/Thr protein kinase RdoA (MazF antagonist)